MSTFIIRDATDREGAERNGAERDRAAINRFMQLLNQAESEWRSDRDLSAPAAADHVDYLLELVRTEGGFVLLAEDQHQTAVGFLVGLEETIPGAFILPHLRRHGYVSDLYVDVAARRCGVATALLNEAARRFKEQGVSRIELSVLAANKNALALYERAGFSLAYFRLQREL